MKLTQMIEKFAKQGMLNGVARAELLQAAEETEQEMAELQEALSGKAVTPGGGVELCAILGREDTLARIRKGIEKLGG